MNDISVHLGFLRKLVWSDILLLVVILAGCSLLVLLTRWMVRLAAERVGPHRRLLILRVAPIIRLLIWIAAIIFVVPILVEPNFEDVATLLATLGLTLAFAFRDYASSLIAGVVTIIENDYQLGDWIEVDGIYGEVKTIGIRAVHIVTADDNEVIIPHAKLWLSNVSNASNGRQNVLVVTYFYLHADHAAADVCQALTEVAETSTYRKQETPITVTVVELPWGTRYGLKAYVCESREQFSMATDLTVRGKERLRSMNVTFAQAVYAEGQGH